MATRRLRMFRRWMRSDPISIDCRDDLLFFTDHPSQGISVRAARDLKEGDVVATIPKSACLTIKTTAARDLIESAALDGCLGLTFALMYEKSLGHASPWAGYLQLLPHMECLPLVWTLDEADRLLLGTELQKAVKEDKALVYEDWRECILPLLDGEPPWKLDPCCFGPQDYFAAKTLVSSRAFQIDDYHGFGMVPLADLFNHKTGAEDVHFTNVSSHSESDSDEDSDSGHNDTGANVVENGKLSCDLFESANDDNVKCIPRNGEGLDVLEMIMVKDVKVGDEVFNTYGTLGNAALLHRYGFTEESNPYDIVNIDLELVLEWSSSLFSDRHTRARLFMWRRLNYSGCVSNDSEYFEISYDGEPQLELLILLHIILLVEDAYHMLDLTVSTERTYDLGMLLSGKVKHRPQSKSELSEELLLSGSVCEALVSLANMREKIYGSSSIEDDMEALTQCSCIEDRKLYYSLTLRVCERRILEKLRRYARVKAKSFRCRRRNSTRKRLRK